MIKINLIALVNSSGATNLAKSGNLTNKNNPDRQHVRGMGPLPRGTYYIVGHSTSKGPMTIILKMTSGQSFGRSEFRIHGERKPPKPPGFASEGCIIMGPHVRSKIIFRLIVRLR